jgi:hypothetical protein
MTCRSRWARRKQNMRLEKISVPQSSSLGRVCQLACAGLIAMASPSLAKPCQASPSAAFTCGNVGHRVVAQVAHSALTPATAAQLSKLVGTNSLGDVANWMDPVRNLPDAEGMKPWHREMRRRLHPVDRGLPGQAMRGSTNRRGDRGLGKPQGRSAQGLARARSLSGLESGPTDPGCR